LKLKLLPAALTVMVILVTFHFSPASGAAILALEHTELWTENDLPSGGGIVNVGDIYAADLDGDSVIEIISIGDTSHAALGLVAELRIGSWNGEAFKLLKEEEWQIEASDTGGRAVYCGDVDRDATVEILTISEKLTPHKGELRIWNWDRATNTLNVEVSRVWEHGLWGVDFNDIAAMDVDGDGTVEIVIAGSESTYAQLRLLKWDGHALTEEHVENWQNTEFYGVGLGDLDMDGLVDIATAGICRDPTEIIDLRVWRWSGVIMTLLASVQWKTMDASTSLKIGFGDLDGDGLREMVTAGRSWMSPHFFGLITIWKWDGVHLDLKAHEEWQRSSGADTEFFSAYAGDVDGDGVADAIVAGAVHAIPGENVLRVYRWDGIDLAAKYSEVWIGTGMSHSFAYTVYSKDVDGDGTIEILTGGRGVGPPEIDAGILSDHGEIDIWGVPVPVSSVRSSIIYAASRSVYFVRTGNIYDDSALGFFYSKCINPQNIILQTDPIRINQTTGRSLFNGSLVTFGGRFANKVTKYYEDQRLAKITFSQNSTHYIFARGSIVAYAVAKSTYNFSREDFFVMQVLQDDSRLVFLIWGVEYTGTYASGICFADIVYPNLASYNESYYIFKWTDLDGNGIQTSNEITQVASGS